MSKAHVLALSCQCSWLINRGVSASSHRTHTLLCRNYVTADGLTNKTEAELCKSSTSHTIMHRWHCCLEFYTISKILLDFNIWISTCPEKNYSPNKYKGIVVQKLTKNSESLMKHQIPLTIFFRVVCHRTCLYQCHASLSNSSYTKLCSTANKAVSKF